MTEQEQNIAIAKACGRPVCEHGTAAWEHEGPEGDRELVCKMCKLSLSAMRVPNYTGSLDAMHEAEKVLLTLCKSGMSDCTWQRYWSNLDTGPVGCVGRKHLLHLTAAQRAEALLKTLNLWKP